MVGYQRLCTVMSKGHILYQRIKEGIALAARVIVTAPVKLPGKLVQGARYVALLIGLLDSLEQAGPPTEADRGEEEVPDAVP